NWRKIKTVESETYRWNMTSTYVQNPPYFEGMKKQPEPIVDVVDARILAMFGDKITTDHISPAGAIKLTSPAGKYLSEHQVRPADFNQYGTRRGNHEVMMRGTFANIRIKNFMLRGADGNIPEGGLTKHWPDGEQMSIYDAAMKYQAEKVPLVVFAGAEYGNGSSRDWAAKGTRLLGVRAVICQSFERIHRSNLVGMGVLPLTFEEGASWQSIGLKGDETVTIRGLQGDLKPRQKLTAEIVSGNGSLQRVSLLCRIDTLVELFTSQGCSSCPPADRILGELAKDPSVIAVSLPIDYWDYLGWKDTLADSRFSARQKAYSQMRGDREVYTPQVVVNGSLHVVGSDRAAIEGAIDVTQKADGVMSVQVTVMQVGKQIDVSV